MSDLLLEYWALVIMNIAAFVTVAKILNDLQKKVSFSQATVDLELIAQRIVSEAIWDFQTDRIHHGSLDPYVRAKYLDLCSKTGLDPEYIDVVQDSARKLIPMGDSVEREGIADFSLMNL